MSTRNKMILSFSAVCLIAVVSIVSIVAVYAASQQRFSSSIKVSYIAKEVEGNVMANWYEGSGGANPMKVNGLSDGATTITFKAGETDQSGELSPTKEVITLDSSKTFVVFEYIFTNTGKEYKAVLEYGDDDESDENINIYAGSSTEQIVPTSALKKGNDKVTLLDHKSGKFLEFNVQTTVFAYIVVSIPDETLGRNASFSGSFNWQLDSTAVE